MPLVPSQAPLAPGAPAPDAAGVGCSQLIPPLKKCPGLISDAWEITPLLIAPHPGGATNIGRGITLWPSCLRWDKLVVLVMLQGALWGQAEDLVCSTSLSPLLVTPESRPSVHHVHK